jgi:hydrogenase expression/formation protein HypD
MEAPHEAFRGKDLIRALAASIERDARGLGPTRIMHVCGTHERSVSRNGLRPLLPPNVRIVAGPGCPVCVCPVSELLAARRLALRARPQSSGILLASFGDMLSVPMPGGSLLEARREGAELRVVYSAADALALARSDSGKEVVFFSVGFETTTAPTAALISSLARSPAPNFSILTANRLVPEALRFLLETNAFAAVPDAADRRGPPNAPLGRPTGILAAPIDGLILPGHVAAIIGSEPFRFLASNFGIPCVVAGFEPVDLLAAIRELLSQKQRGVAELANLYSRVVRPEGNARAKELMTEVFEKRDAEWRGLGVLPGTGLALKPEFTAYDARVKFAEPLATSFPADSLAARESAAEEKSCLCPRVVLGLAESEDCPLFGTTCLPERPVGPCMVSEEGTCRIRFEHGGAA